MPVRTLACVGLLLVTAPLPHRSAQATGDQARLIFTVSAGAAGGKDLWSVADAAGAVHRSRPIRWRSGRRIRSTLVVGFRGRVLPGEHLGLSAEGFLIGFGFEDCCRQVFSSGSAGVAAACKSIQCGHQVSHRRYALRRTDLPDQQPEVCSLPTRANAGFLFSTQSSLRTIGQLSQRRRRGSISSFMPTTTIPGWSRHSLWEAGFTAASPGYQLRWEVRDNIVGVQKVIGSTPVSGVVPPHELDFKHLFSLTMGFDVVLERRRGRRY